MAHKIDTATASPTQPTPGVGGTPGFFVDGNPALGVPGTNVSADWLNSVQGEITSVIAAAGLALDKSRNDQLLTSIRALARIKLSQALTLYVATTGSDTTGDGSSATPFATVTKAWNYLLAAFDINGQQVTIQVQNGTYTTPFVAAAPPIGAFNVPVVIQGNTLVPSAVTLNVGNAIGMFFYNCGPVVVRGFKIIASGTTSIFSSQGIGILSQGSSNVIIGNMDFGACGFAQLYAAYGGFLSMYNATAPATVPYTISGGSRFHAVAADNGVLVLIGAAVTLTGTPAFADAFVYASFGQLHAHSMSFTGSATGPRYLSTNLGMIINNGGGANYYPGSTAGTVNANSYYG